MRDRQGGELSIVLDPRFDDPAFPTLDELQIERVRVYGTELDVDAGTVLFCPADDSYDFIVVLEGEVEIVRASGDSEVPTDRPARTWPVPG